MKTKDGKNMDLLVEFPKGHLTLIDGLSLSYITKCTYIFIIRKINWIFKKLYYVKLNIEEYLDYTIFLKIRKFMLCNSFLGPISLRNSTTYSNFATCTSKYFSEALNLETTNPQPKLKCLGFTYNGAKLFNMLPIKLKKVEDPSAFKTMTKEWIWENIPSY